jgi:hypothetical protein
MRSKAIRVGVCLVVAAFATVLAAKAPAQGKAQTPYYVLDGYGYAHAGNGAPVLVGLPYFGWDIARDLEVVLGATGTPAYVLDGMGGLWSANGAPPLLNLKWWGDDVYEDLEFVYVGCDGGRLRRVEGVVLDALGGVWEVSTIDEFGVLWLWTTNKVEHSPWNMAASRADGDETPFFGFDVARDIEIPVNPYRGEPCSR